jgi:hypothetical protein
MAGLFGIGGSAAKTDRKYQLQSWGELSSLFGPAAKAGQKQTAEGAEGLTKSRNYFEALMSGDPAKMSAVLAPQISTLQQQTGRGVNTLGQFAGRSGGTAAQAQELGIEAQRSIQNLFDLLGPEAAKEVASISGAQESMGMGLTDIAASAAGEVGAQASGSRQQTVPQQQQQQAAIMEALAALI